MKCIPTQLTKNITNIWNVYVLIKDNIKLHVQVIMYALTDFISFFLNCMYIWAVYQV